MSILSRRRFLLPFSGVDKLQQKTIHRKTIQNIDHTCLTLGAIAESVHTTFARDRTCLLRAQCECVGRAVQSSDIPTHSCCSSHLLQDLQGVNRSVMSRANEWPKPLNDLDKNE